MEEQENEPGKGKSQQRVHTTGDKWSTVPLDNSGRQCGASLSVTPALGDGEEAGVFIHLPHPSLAEDCFQGHYLSRP